MEIPGACTNGEEHFLYIYKRRPTVIIRNRNIFKIRIIRECYIVVRCADCRGCWLPEVML